MMAAGGGALSSIADDYNGAGQRENQEAMFLPLTAFCL